MHAPRETEPSKPLVHENLGTEFGDCKGGLTLVEDEWILG